MGGLTFTKEQKDWIRLQAFHELDKHADELDRLEAFCEEYCSPPSMMQWMEQERKTIEMLRGIETELLKDDDAADFCSDAFDI